MLKRELQILEILWYFIKAKLIGLDGQGKCEKFLDLQNLWQKAKKKQKKTFYETKLFTVTKFVKQGISVFVKST
jgi:hypothetical protein